MWDNSKFSQKTMNFGGTALAVLLFNVLIFVENGRKVGCYGIFGSSSCVYVC